MKRFQLWIKRPSLALPVCSSESARIRPSAEASGMVRKARRKLLALRKKIGEVGLGNIRSSNHMGTAKYFRENPIT